MRPQNTTARIAGLIYVIMAITGVFIILYVPLKLVVWSDANATVQNIIESEALYRKGVLIGLLTNLLFLVLPFVLYRLLESVNKTMAGLMVLFAVISVPVSLVALGSQFDVLSMLQSSESVVELESGQLQSAVMASLYTHKNLTFVATFFWGLWLFPFGWLVYHSGFLPKFFGVFLMAGCFGYLIEFVALTLWPDVYSASGISNFIHIPSAIGEIGIAFWLLIRGVKEPSKGVEN
ncbi:MAG: DUF4386 family protein [Bacteroidetes bacterium]|jgi:hypothetical protein|nr:DUF4386 family protein [Bacteroidota bacterium]